MLSPLVSRPVSAGVGRLFSRRLPGRLGRENAVRNPRRTAATAAALMIGLALISAVTVLGSSLKASVAKITSAAVDADFILNTNGPGFPDAVVTDAAQTPGVDKTAGVKVDGMQLCDNASCSHAKQTVVTAFPAAAIGELVNISTVSGSDNLAPGTILMSKSAAKSDKLTVGDPVTVQFARSEPEKLTLGGTYETNQLIGDYLVDASKAKDFSDPTQRRGPRQRRAPGPMPARSARIWTRRCTRYPQRGRAGPVGVRRPDAEPGQPDRHDHQHPAGSVGHHRAARRAEHAGAVRHRAHPRDRPAARRRDGPHVR